MIQKIFVVAVLFLLFGTIISCGSNKSTEYGESKIAWNDFDTATQTAQLQDKKLFIYFHTDWCSWCRKMENETFTNDSVAEFLNNNFIAVTIDAESEKQVTYNGRTMSQQELASTFGVQGFPSHVFLNQAGEPITLTPGFMPAERFLNVLSYIADDHYQTMEWEEFMLSISS